MTDKKTEEELEQEPCIRYPVTFKDQTEALLDSGSEVNAMSQAFAQQLGFKIRRPTSELRILTALLWRPTGW